jgi:membrane protease YdiL (CAAX protease family)
LNDFDAANAEFRLVATVAGDRIGRFEAWLEIPQQWQAKQSALAATRQNLALGDGLLVALLALAMLGVCIWQAAQRQVRWRAAASVAGALGLATLLQAINDAPEAMSSYKTTETFAALLTEKILLAAAASAGMFVFMLALFAAGEALGRRQLGAWPLAPRGLTGRELLFGADTPRQFVLGYATAAAMLGYVTVFYLVGQRYAGVWSPVEVPVNGNFSSFFPAFAAFTVGASASMMEELLFRIFPIALLLWLTRRPWLAVLVPALLWGFAHSGYPQEPIWIRGVEVSLVGLALGAIFLRFGLLVTLVAHFAYDCLLFGMAMVQTGRPSAIAAAVLAVAAPLVLLLPRLLWRKRAAGMAVAVSAGALDSSDLSDLSDLSDTSESSARSPAGSPLPWRAALLFLLLAAVWWGASFLPPKLKFYDDPPPPKLTKSEAAAKSAELARGLGLDLGEFRYRIEYAPVSRQPPESVIDALGPDETFRRYGQHYWNRAAWHAFWFREQNLRKVEVWFADDGELVTFHEHLPDADPGAKLDDDAARAIAVAFLAQRGIPVEPYWRTISVTEHARPNRRDVDFVFGDQRLTDLDRRVHVTVAGDRVTEYWRPNFHTPEDWTRRRAIEKTTWRNQYQKPAGIAIAAILTILYFVQLVVFLQRRQVKPADLWPAAAGGLLLGLLPAALDRLNSLPNFYAGFFEKTTQSFADYATMQGLQFLAQVIAAPIAIFAIAFGAVVALRAWAPELGDWRTVAGPLHPRRWGDGVNLQGLALGVGLALFLAANDVWHRALFQAVLPRSFEPARPLAGFDVNRISESLGQFAELGLVLRSGVKYLLVALAARRWLRRGWQIALAIVVYALVFEMPAAYYYTWPHFALGAVYHLAEVTAVYFLVTRVLRWNVTAYLVALWVNLFLRRPEDFFYLTSPSADFFWPTVQRLAWAIAPGAALLLAGAIRKRNKV